jgi:hypothetical protein
MSGNANNGSLLKAAKLWAKTSVKGGQYLTGRLGGVKVLILENRDRKSDDEPSHHLFFAEAAPRQDAQERGDGQRGASGCPRSARGHPRRNAAALRGMPAAGRTGRRRCGRRVRRGSRPATASTTGRHGNGEFFDTGKRAGGEFPDWEKGAGRAVFPAPKSDKNDSLKAARRRVSVALKRRSAAP